MDSLLDPVELNRETTQTLDQIRSGAETELYGTTSAEAETNLNRLVLPLIEGSGMPNLQVMHYRWFLRELAPVAHAQRPGPRVPPRTLHQKMDQPRARTEDAPVPRLRSTSAPEGKGPYH